MPSLSTTPLQHKRKRTKERERDPRRELTSHSFTVNPTTLHFFKSPDSPRTFLVLKVHPSTPHPNPLTTLLQKCNATASHFSLPLLYAHATGVDEAAFHVSLAWTLDEVPVDTSWTERLLGESGVKAWGIPVEGVKVKIGNVVTNVPLGPSSENRGLFG